MRRTTRLLLLLSLLFLLPTAAPVLAGGGPANTLIVVNARSPVSRRIAREYVALRDIPPSNVLELADVPHIGVITQEQFLELIWKPIERKLQSLGPVRLITYSGDFPYGVRFENPHAKAGGDAGGKQQRMMVGGIASLNGVTYLIKHVKAGEEFWNLAINPYYGLASPRGPARPRPANSDERGHYAKAMAAMGQKDYATAAASFARLLETYADAAQPHYNYACCLARLGKADEALAALRKAVGCGWANPTHTAQDPDLASLRGRADFEAVLGSMNGKVLPSRAFDLDGYYLSTTLAYTGPYGNSVPEALAYLRAAAKADGTNPDGTVYFLKNGNVRSTTREPFLPLLSEGLKQRGRKFALLEGVLPQKKDDVIGAVVGSAGFDWGKSGSRILPGAICEHLTSFGAHFGTPGQTKLSEFLRYGAAGASGTVMEPLALHWKFPNPVIHLFYADGCSLAEAFFQSVWGPYQLMIVGDGLARPFAKFRKVEVVSGEPKCEGAKRFEVWKDGALLDRLPDAPAGVELRVVAIHDPVDTRSYVKLAESEAPPPPEPRDRDYRKALLFGARPTLFRSVGGTWAARMRRRGHFEVAKRGQYQLYVSGQGQITIDGVCPRTPLDKQLFLPLLLDAGWHYLDFDFEPAGKGKLEVGLGGDQVYAPLRLSHPALKSQPSTEGDLAKGLVLTWKRVTKDIGLITLTAKKGSAKNWVVEIAAGKKWTKVEGVSVDVEPGVLVELSFAKPLRARRLRLRAEGNLAFTALVVGGG